jgi:hypothetical protein
MKQQVNVIFRDKTKDDLWVDVDSEASQVEVLQGILIIATSTERYLIPMDAVHYVHTEAVANE